jgi:hypothetical protein
VNRTQNFVSQKRRDKTRNHKMDFVNGVGAVLVTLKA